MGKHDQEVMFRNLKFSRNPHFTMGMGWQRLLFLLAPSPLRKAELREGACKSFLLQVGIVRSNLSFPLPPSLCLSHSCCEHTQPERMQTWNLNTRSPECTHRDAQVGVHTEINIHKHASEHVDHTHSSLLCPPYAPPHTHITTHAGDTHRARLPQLPPAESELHLAPGP